jgi:hypothetical protein
MMWRGALDAARQPALVHAPGLAAVIARAFEKDPAARYPDPGTFAGELWQCVPDAVDYDECISDRISAWWPTAEPATPSPAQPGERCRMAWDQLHPTATDGVRHCASCNHEVVRAESLAALVLLAGRRCVSYTGGD